MIYLVEDEKNIRELVIYTLKNTGFDVVGFSSSDDFWKAVLKTPPRLILLDIALPGENGLEILKKLRNSPSTAKIPVMMLTAKSTEYDKVFGLDSGADDYLAKPFGMMELVARVKSLLRRSNMVKEPDEYRIGDLFISVSRHLASVKEETVPLTHREFELLLYLIRNQGRVLSRDQILSSVWRYYFNGETRTVDVHIRSLREKLGVCGQLIQTVRGVGYKVDK